MHLSRRHLIQSASAATLLANIGGPAWAQVMESVKDVAGFAPGGTADIVSRRVADKLQPAYANSAAMPRPRPLVSTRCLDARLPLPLKP